MASGAGRKTPQVKIVFGVSPKMAEGRFEAWKAATRSFALSRGARLGVGVISLIAIGLVYAFSNPAPAGHFDYQTRIADALLSGHLGIPAPPPWLNEMTPDPHGDGFYYSVFPLGSVLSFLPIALLKRGLPEAAFTNESVRWIVALLSTGIAFFLFRLSARCDHNNAPLLRRLTLTAFVLFGSWLWPNLAFGAAWHLALGLAVLGEAAALYFLLSNRPHPLLAGFWFALAFGNRTEILLTTPLFLYLLWRQQTAQNQNRRWRIFLPAAGAFLAFPFVLGIATLLYNDARYGSVADFGYERIPGVLKEMWYRDGLTSWIAFPMNCHAMLLEAAWRVQIAPPYLVPNPMGGSIFASSPYLFLLFQGGGKNRGVVVASWIAIALLTLVLWSHGNSGGWQFSYRYALVLLPWAFVILTEISPPRVRLTEILLLTLSIALNAFAVYQFFWTNGVHV